MSSLKRLQASFQNAVLADDGAFLDAIDDAGRIGPSRRVAIYADAYRLRLIEALAENYAGLCALLGEKAFEETARRYIETHPSPYRSIRWYGESMDNHVAETDGLEVAAAARDMARVDWAMTLSFDAPDARVAGEEDVACFAPQDWPMLMFEAHPSLIRLDLEYNAPQLRRSLLDPEDGSACAIERQPAPIPWLIWRQGLSVRYRSLQVDEAWALDAARDGSDFASICAGLTEWVDEARAPMRAATFLKQWLADGLISQVALADQDAAQPEP